MKSIGSSLCKDARSTQTTKNSLKHFAKINENRMVLRQKNAHLKVQTEDHQDQVSGLTRRRACLHGGGGPQVGEVTRLAVVEKWPAFTCKLVTPGSWGDVTRHCCVVARHVNKDNGGRTTHFGGQCSFLFIICSRCSISMLRLFTVTFDDTKLPPKAVNCSGNATIQC